MTTSTASIFHGTKILTGYFLSLDKILFQRKNGSFYYWDRTKDSQEEIECDLDKVTEDLNNKITDLETVVDKFDLAYDFNRDLCSSFSKEFITLMNSINDKILFLKLCLSEAETFKIIS